MKKVIRLTESDLQKVIKRVIIEEEESHWRKYGFDDEESFYENYVNVDEYARELTIEVEEEIRDLLINFFEQTDFVGIVKESVESRQKMFKERYPQYSNVGELGNDYIDSLLTANPDLESEDVIDEVSLFLMDFIIR